MGQNMDYSQIVILLAGIYSIFRGFMVLLTGKLTRQEEERMRGYSEAGILRFKKLSSAFNIVGGLLIAAISVVKLLGLVIGNAFRIVSLVILVAMLIAYVLIMKSCKNVK